MKALPTFKPRPHAYVHDFISRVLVNSQVSEDTHLRDLVTYPEGYYRAIFAPTYFVLAEATTEPTKSQWNTLKKRVKRLNPGVFVFKEYGIIPCNAAAPAGQPDDYCLYLDFGFFAH